MPIPPRRLAVAGIAAPILFITLVLIQEFLQPDYRPAALPVSALAAWPLGWLQRVNFAIYAALGFVFYQALNRGIRPSKRGWIGIALLFLSSIGGIIAALISWKFVDGRLVEPGGHVVGAISHFLGAALGIAVLSRRLAADPVWKSLAPYSLASGVAMLVVFLVFAIFALDPKAPLAPWGGILQRVAVVVLFTWMIVSALRLRRGA